MAVVTAAVMLASAAGSFARAHGDQDLADARAAVLGQLDAFRRGDWDGAYGFASEEIRAVFDRERFEAMVRGGYPEIAEPAVARIDAVHRAPNGHVYVFVRVRGASGRAVEAVYEMVHEAGRWKVNGVVTRRDTSEPV
jgi:hypothetical protein